MRRARVRSSLVAASLAVLASSAACGGGDEPGDDDPFPPPPEGEGFQLEMTRTVPAGTEIWDCLVSEVPVDEFTPVNHVESIQNDSMHHMDLTALAFAGVDLEPGLYDCNQVYEDHPELMDDGLILYASQQAEQEITLPPGVIANLPGRLKVMHEIHYVNATPEPVEAYSRVNVYRYDGSIEAEIWGGAVRDVDMEIPPGESTQWTRCVMNEDIDLLFLSSHTHALAEKVEIRAFDGTDVGEVIYANTDWHAPPLLGFPEPLRVPAGHGFEFTCFYDNPGPDTVRWGFSAAEEMCQIALVFTPGEANRRCEVVATSDGLGLD